MPKPPTSLFSDVEVLEIRREAALSTLDVRAWANLKRCSLETVRRIARRDTHRHVVERAVPTLDGPSPEEIAAAFERLQKAVAEAPPSPREADKLLDELMKGRT